MGRCRPTVSQATAATDSGTYSVQPLALEALQTTSGHMVKPPGPTFNVPAASESAPLTMPRTVPLAPRTMPCEGLPLLGCFLLGHAQFMCTAQTWCKYCAQRIIVRWSPYSWSLYPVIAPAIRGASFAVMHEETLIKASTKFQSPEAPSGRPETGARDLVSSQ